MVNILETLGDFVPLNLDSARCGAPLHRISTLIGMAREAKVIWFIKLSELLKLLIKILKH